MSVEQGLVMLIQARLQALTPAVNVPGGFFAELPKDQNTVNSASPQAWAYRGIISRPEYALSNQLGWTEWEVQIDCHGTTQADAVTLARAIETVLRAPFPAKLPDPEQTGLFGIFRLPAQIDLFADISRTFVRSLEFTVQYQQV